MVLGIISKQHQVPVTSVFSLPQKPLSPCTCMFSAAQSKANYRIPRGTKFLESNFPLDYPQRIRTSAPAPPPQLQPWGRHQSKRKGRRNNRYSVERQSPNNWSQILAPSHCRHFEEQMVSVTKPSFTYESVWDNLFVALISTVWTMSAEKPAQQWHVPFISTAGSPARAAAWAIRMIPTIA